MHVNRCFITTSKYVVLLTLHQFIIGIRNYERKRFKRKLKILDLMYNSTLGTITVIRNIYLVTV